MEAAHENGSVGDRGRYAGSDWARRFRQASAAKRRYSTVGNVPGNVEQSDSRGALFDSADRKSAREVDPTKYLESLGFLVMRAGPCDLSATINGREVYRLTKQKEGHWLWCDYEGRTGGDNIDLVQTIEPDIAFHEAIKILMSTGLNQVNKTQSNRDFRDTVDTPEPGF